jgi:hypothetical protein
VRVRVLVGTSNVLSGLSNVLGGSSRVLGGSSYVLGGSSRVLVAVIVRVLVDAELGRRDAGAQHALRVHVSIAQGEAAERALQLVERQAGVDERTERHVAGDAGKAVEI